MKKLMYIKSHNKNEMICHTITRMFLTNTFHELPCTVLTLRFAIKSAGIGYWTGTLNFFAFDRYLVVY